MKIAISCQDGTTISGHVGRCTQFIVYDIKDNHRISKSIVSFDEEKTFHNILHSLMLPFMDHPLFNVDIILSGSMGKRFVEKMKIKGIEAFLTSEKDPDIAIEKYLEGILEKVEVEMHHRH